MDGYSIDAGPEYSLLRLDDFANDQCHAFVIRGERRAPLFKLSPVPEGEICEAAGLAGAILHLPKQVQGARVVEVPAAADPEDAGPRPVPREIGPSRAAKPAQVGTSLPNGALGRPEADALVTGRAGHAIGVATADCLPILIAAPGGLCAAVHAGWRGLLAGVIEAALSGMAAAGEKAARSAGAGDARTRDRSLPARVAAAIGPSIGPCCFEVGAQVAEQFLARFPGDGGFLRPSRMAGKSYADLRASAARAMEEAGVRPGSLRTVDICTRCGGDLYESYRRDGQQAGRMIALIGPRLH